MARLSNSLWSTWVTGVTLLLCALLLVSEAPSAQAQLRLNFYRGKCRNRRIDVEAVVRKSITQSFNQDSSLPGGIARIFFHDAFVHGPDASLLLDGDTSEKTARPNGGLHGFEALDAAKAAVEAACPGVVSCADILSFATRDLIRLTGGPSIRLRGGRRDGLVGQASDVGDPNVKSNQIPGPQQKVSGDGNLADIFAAHGLGVQDLVVLSGMHTIGGARCRVLQGRIFQNPPDPNLNADLLAQLQQQCPAGQNLDVRVPMDSTARFDNSYFVGLTQSRGVFISDDDLFRDPSTTALVTKYASFVGGKVWLNIDFPASFKTLSENNAKTGTAGEIRLNCRQVNGPAAAPTVPAADSPTP